MYALKKYDVSVAEDGEMWIKGKRGKTGIEYQVPLHDLPLEIIERYRDTAQDGRLLPMYCNSHMNVVLKEIARTCGIARRLTYHQSHHNFGTHITLSMGVPIETVSKMMEHKNITITQIYAKVTDKKVDEDMKRMRVRTVGQKVSLHEDEKLRTAIRFPGAKRQNNNA